MRAVIYARYSAGPKQTDQSIEGQLRVCRDFCENKKLTIVDEYCDRHITGKTDARPEFQRMIADAKKKLFKVLVVYKTDRFARNKYDSAIYKSQLRKLGIQIMYAAEAIPDGPEGIILESLMEGFAEYYSAELSQKVKRGMRESAQKCHCTGSGISLGYKVLPDKSFAIDENEAKIVRKIANMYIAGMSKAEICRKINASGATTKKGKPFTINSLSKLIKNERYIGIYRYDDIVIKDGMPRILSDEVFEKMQEETKKRAQQNPRRSTKAEYLLSGKLYCGYCNTLMIGVSGTSKTKDKHYYYACSNQKNKKGCNKKAVRRDYLDDLVVEYTIANLLQPDRLKELAHKIFEYQSKKPKEDLEIKELRRRLNMNKKSTSNIVLAIENGNNPKVLLERLEQLEDERAAIEYEIKKQQRTTQLSENEILSLLGRFITERDKHEIINNFVTAVYLYDGEFKIFYSLNGGEQKFNLGELSSTNTLPSRTPNTTIVVGKQGILLTAKIKKRVC